MQVPLGCGLVPGPPPEPPLPIPQDSSLASVIVGVIQVLFTAGAALVMDRAGRRLLLALSGEARRSACANGGPGQAPTAGWRAFAKATMWWEEEDKCP